MASISDIDPLAAIGLGAQVAGKGLEGLGIKPRLYRRSPEPTQQLHKYSTRHGHRWNQDLESRGYLRFLYELSDGSYQDRVLPFIENPTFNESRSANYAENNILSRNEQARLYTGSKARRIDTSFSYTLPHLAHFVPTSVILKDLTERSTTPVSLKDLEQAKSYLTSIVEKDVTKGAFKITDPASDPRTPGAPTESVQLTTEEKVKQAKQVISGRMDSLEGPVGPFLMTERSSNSLLPFLKTNSDARLDNLWNAFLLHVMEVSGRELEVLSVFQSAINHIRASVIGSSTNPKRSPPIVLLKWGAIYNEVPCIVRDYRIELTDRAGYNTKTLLPQQIVVQMTLEEINQAHGSIPGRSTVTGNLPGYDTIVRLTKPEDVT